MIERQIICSRCKDEIVRIPVPTLLHKIVDPVFCTNCKAALGDREAQRQVTNGKKMVKNLLNNYKAKQEGNDNE